MRIQAMTKKSVLLLAYFLATSLSSKCGIWAFTAPRATHRGKISTFTKSLGDVVDRRPSSEASTAGGRGWGLSASTAIDAAATAAASKTTMPRISSADVDTLAEKGCVVIPNFLPKNLVDELRNDVRDVRGSGKFRQAKIGQDGTNNLNEEIRVAETCFLGRNRPELLSTGGQGNPRDREGGLYDILDAVCEELSDVTWASSSIRLDKSLTELLYAYYPSGGFYRRHRDAIPNSASVLRRYSLLLYLNRDDWSPEVDGGQLRIHFDGGGDELLPGATPDFVDVDPLGGTLVLFKSDLIPHEVLDTNSERFALVGWYNRAVTASDILSLGDGGGSGGLGRIGLLVVAFALVTVGVASILGQ